MGNSRATLILLAVAALLSVFRPCLCAENADGRDVESYYMRYIALKTIDGFLANGGTREAFAYIDSVLPKVPEKDKLPFLLMKIETALIDSGRGTREGFRAHMSGLLAAGEYSEAIDLAGATLSVALPSSPAKIDNYVWIMTMLADAYHRIGDPASAINTLSKAQSLKDTYELHVAKGSIYASEGKFKEAEQEYAIAVKLNSNEPGIYEAKAWNLRTLGRIRDAENDLQAGLALDPDNPRLLKATAY
ncbi:MAG TPA: tetratricopeptide repeat protein, partial [Candidatus Omnitrophota bacterium]|nr:tetratricopeptide repeat protein [Candidatus Omnitrophota bacterium]